MITYLLQIYEAGLSGSIPWYSILFLFSIFHFTLRIFPSIWYKTPPEGKVVPTGVIIPVVDEDPDEFIAVVEQYLKYSFVQKVVVVLNGDFSKELGKRLVDTKLPIHIIATQQAGKRNALALGAKHLQDEFPHIQVYALADSDTLIKKGSLSQMVRPLMKKGVGGVMSRQVIRNHDVNFVTKFAHLTEKIRNTFSGKTFSLFGVIPCLPGRLYVIRKEILFHNLERFLHDPFLGVHVEFSDDRTITNYALEMGYKTILTDNVVVETDAPTKLGKYWKQQVRWARGSQYNNLRTLGLYWKRSKLLLYFTVVDMLLPFMFFALPVALTVQWLSGSELDSMYAFTVLDYTAFALMGMAVLYIVKFWSIFDNEDWMRLPQHIFMASFFIPIIRMYGFLTMALNSSWGTRTGGFVDTKRKPLIAYLPFAVGVGIFIGFVVLFALYPEIDVLGNVG